MPCYSPLRACQHHTGGKPIFLPSVSKDASGKNLVSDQRQIIIDTDYIVRKFGVGYKRIFLPCGRCIGCRLERSRQWAVRCMHEASMHKRNCFLSLTYAPEFLPEGGTLCYRHFQLFMKKLRKYFGGTRIRFYMCGEYGGKKGRPHYHACLFGVDFDDKKLWGKSDSGHNIYRSAILEKLWTFGFSSVGDLCFASAAYTARYIVDKVTGDLAVDHYSVTDIVNPVTGEVFQKVPEFNNMSRKPGIASDWFDKYSADVFPHDYVVVNGKECKPPRYYDKKWAEFFFDEFELIKKCREERAKTSPCRTSIGRWSAEKNKQAQLKRLKRKDIGD